MRLTHITFATAIALVATAPLALAGEQSPPAQSFATLAQIAGAATPLTEPNLRDVRGAAFEAYVPSLAPYYALSVFADWVPILDQKECPQCVQNVPGTLTVGLDQNGAGTDLVVGPID